MDLITDGLLAAGAVFAGLYCFVLARRVRALTDLDTGIGGAITTLNRQLAQAEAALAAAKTASAEGRDELRELIASAEAASGRLRMLIAASRDPEERANGGPAAPSASREKPPAPARAAALRPVRLSEVAPAETKASPELAEPLTSGAAGRQLDRKGASAPSARTDEADLIAALEAIAAGGAR
jgi:Domain of unknown function (DUF6468)